MLLAHPGSPAPAYSDAGSPTKKGFSLLSPFRKRAESPTSSLAGSDLGTPRSLFPSFTSGQRKREVIKKQEEDLSLLHVQVHQQESQLARLQQQLQAEVAARVEALEQLNMQYFKANLLADMLVVQLLDLDGSALTKQPASAAPTASQAAAVQQQQGTMPAATAAAPSQQQQQQQGPPNAAAGWVGPQGAPMQQQMVIEETSFD